MTHSLFENILAANYFSASKGQAELDVQQYGRIVLNRDVALKLRFRWFDAVIPPNILFGMFTLPLRERVSAGS